MRSGTLRGVDDRTVPTQTGGDPVQGIRITVETGPDAGRTAMATTDAITIGTAEGNDLRLQDETVSRFHLRVERSGARIELIDQGSTNGTRVGVVELRGTSVRVDPGAVVQIGATELRIEDDRVEMVELGPSALGAIRGRTPKMRRLMASTKHLAQSDVPVLIVGESGTGKELVARALHEHGARRDAPFVTVDCGVHTPTLFASELFGYVKGAFTGADADREGAFERAHGGTLFLDEIGELSPELQSSLLGVLQRGRFKRLGGQREIEVDVRVISATHRDLRGDVNARQFRLDLFYRLAVVVLTVPPLRERRDDIALLVRHILEEVAPGTEVDDVFPPEEMRRLERHTWPGNVRELRNIVLGTLALGNPPDLREAAVGDVDAVERVLGMEYKPAKRLVLDDFERRFLEDLLQRAEGSVRKAARLAKVDRNYLTELLRKHQLC